MSSPNQRNILIDRMNSLIAEGVSCMGCEGKCCTFESNSMMVTPLEAVELMTYLKTHSLLTSVLREKLEISVRSNRLENRPLDLSRRSYLRKTYTCPFFEGKELGCPLPPEVKPYGCLAFNSHHPDKKASEFCFSEIDLLERREALHPEEDRINAELRVKYGLYWEKGPIPAALLDIWDKFSDEDL